MYWFFNCNNYHRKAIKALVYSAFKYNPHFKPVCIWDEPVELWPDLKEWLEDKGIIVHKYQSSLGDKINSLSKREYFDFTKLGCDSYMELNKEGLNGMWAKADIPKMCEDLGIKDDFVLATDPDCMFVAEYDLDLKPEIIAAAPEEEPYREWISGGIYIFNVKRCLEDRYDFHKWVLRNYRAIGYVENISYMRYYGYDNITHISPDWNYKPWWEKERDYLVSPEDRAIFRSTPKLIHFQGVSKPWLNPDMPENTDMKLYCDMWHDFVKLSDEICFKFNS